MSKLNDAREYERIQKESISASERPVYHLTPEIGWMNDPNGFSFFQGEYHLFYQYYPYDVQWSDMYWGHAKTKDFIKWEYLPTALAPDEEYETGCFSGSALETKTGEHLLLYTAHKQTAKDGEVLESQCIAIGDGIEYTKYESNPVIPIHKIPSGFSKNDFRDPKIWKEEDGYYAVIGGRYLDGRGAILLYYSRDFYQWEFLQVLTENNGEYGTMWECPDFFELDEKAVLITSPMEMKKRDLEFYEGHGNIYMIGDYEKSTHRFQSEEKYTIDHGLDFYAPQTVETADGRRILVGWMQRWDNYLTPAGQKWSGMMTIPRELKIRNNRLCQWPVKEIENYYSNSMNYANIEVEGNNKVTLEKVSGRCLDLLVHIKNKEYDTFTICVAENDRYHTAIILDRKEKTLTVDRSKAGMESDKISRKSMRIDEYGNEVAIRILLDRYSVELFVNDGEQVMSSLIYTTQEADGISFYAEGKAVIDVQKYDIIQS